MPQPTFVGGLSRGQASFVDSPLVAQYFLLLDGLHTTREDGIGRVGVKGERKNVLIEAA